MDMGIHADSVDVNSEGKNLQEPLKCTRIYLEHLCNVLVESETSPTIESSGSCKWAVKSRQLFFRANLRTWMAFINSGLILFLFLVSVSALEENTHSQETADACMGK
jgi:hypothetical protein